MNPRHSRWQRDALPLSYTREVNTTVYPCRRDLQGLFAPIFRPGSARLSGGCQTAFLVLCALEGRAPRVLPESRCSLSGFASACHSEPPIGGARHSERSPGQPGRSRGIYYAHGRNALPQTPTPRHSRQEPAPDRIGGGSPVRTMGSLSAHAGQNSATLALSRVPATL